MSRLPFDPDRVRGGEAKAPKRAGGEAPLSVSQITELINQALIDRLPRKVSVVGEISNLSRRGHWYFSLKDETAVLKCVAWASKASKFGFDAKDGLSVVARGAIQHYGPQGQTQLYVDALEPVGAGALELRFRALCEELRALGYFDVDRKKPVPMFPRRVAIITSARGAALQDCLDTMRRRCTAVEILVVDVRVQGAQAAGEIARAIRHISKHHARLRVDALLLTRGGGSIEDLWAFNERIVAEALRTCPIATVAAIGHETDTTIAELVADLRCATPTQAAMRLAPDQRELLAQIDQSELRLALHLRHRLRYAAQHLHALKTALCTGGREALHDRAMRTHRLALRLGPLRPDRVIIERSRRLGLAAHRLHAAAAHAISQRRPQPGLLAQALHRAAADSLGRAGNRLDRAQATLRSVDPRRVLARGYSITHKPDGTVIRSVADAGPGQRLLTNVSDGTIESEVTGSALRPPKPAAGSPTQPHGAPPRRRTRRGAAPPNQMELFDHLR